MHAAVGALPRVPIDLNPLMDIAKEPATAFTLVCRPEPVGNVDPIFGAPSRRERPISRLARCRSADGAEPVSDERPVTGHPAERDTSQHKASVSQSLDIR